MNTPVLELFHKHWMTTRPATPFLKFPTKGQLFLLLAPPDAPDSYLRFLGFPPSTDHSGLFARRGRHRLLFLNYCNPL